MASSFFSQAKKNFGSATKQAQSAINKVTSQVNQQVSLVGQYVGQNRSIEDLEDESTLQLSGHFIVEVVRAANLPKPGLLDGKGVVVSLRVCSSRGVLRGVRVHTLPRRASVSPSFHTVRNLKMQPETGDVVMVEVGEAGARPELRGMVAVEYLIGQNSAELEVPLWTNLAPAQHHPTVTLKCHPTPGTMDGLTKTVFFIRHGESKWNEAQADMNLKNMLAFDHPLNETGVSQSERLRDRWCRAITSSTAPMSPLPPEKPLIDFAYLSTSNADSEACEHFSAYQNSSKSAAGMSDVQKFLAAEVVYASPLTRAVQTALVALFGHPAVASSGIQLLQSAREVKATLGGLDSIGKAIGEDIRVRALETLSKETSPLKAQMYCSAHLGTQDVLSDWWTSEREMDTDAELAERLDDFLHTLLLQPPAGPESSVVVVGHSLFFMEFFKRYSGTTMEAHKPGLVENLRERKMANASCIAVDLRYQNYRAEIVDARLLFDSDFDR